MDNDMILSSNIYLMGKSFGGAVAAYMLTQLSTREGIPANVFFKGLVLESTFTSLKDVIGEKTKGWLPETLYSDN